MTSFTFPRALFRLAVVAASFAAALARAADGIEWIAISPPASAPAGSTIQFSATVRNTGTTTWNNDCFLELKDAAGTHLNYPSIAGVGLGGTITCTFSLTLPTTAGDHVYSFTGLRHNVAYFGPTPTRTITATPLPVYQGTTLSSLTLAPGALPTIDTQDAMTPHYRLRAKIAHPNTNGWGWHAANDWYNKGFVLDNPVTIPGTYQLCSLYWLKYSAQGGTLLEMGPERFVSLLVPGGVIALEYYAFGHLTPPEIFTTAPQELGGTYWLFAKFRNGSGGVWEAAPRPANAAQGSNNNHAHLSLADLPPPGDYEVELSWKRYDENGNVFATGPGTGSQVLPRPVVIFAGAGPILSVTDCIERNGDYDENGNWETQLDVDRYDFDSPINGTLQITISNASFDALTELCTVNNNDEETQIATGGATLSLGAAAGAHYRLRITSTGGTGSYTATANVLSALTPPTFVNAGTAASGTFGTAFSSNLAVATSSGTIIYSVRTGGENDDILPPGLTLQSNGMITGYPTAPGGRSPTIRATNASGAIIEKTISFAIAKATPDAEFPNVIVNDQLVWFVTQSMLTGTGGVGGAKFLRPAGAPSYVPAPTGAPTFSARAKMSNSTYNPFTPASLPSYGVNVYYGELFVTAHYAGDANYLPWTKTATFWNRDTMPPNAPTNLHVALAGSTAVSVAWDPSTDNANSPVLIAPTYEVSLDGAVQADSHFAPTYTFNSLAPGSPHTVSVRAKDYSGGNFSAPISFSFTVPLSAPDPSATPRWVDIDGPGGNGIRDEVIGGNTTQFNYLVGETSSETFTSTNWTSYFETIVLPSGADGGGYFIFGWWNDTEDTTTETVATVRPVFQILADPGYDYVICRAVINPQNQIEYKRIIKLSRDTAGIIEWFPNTFWPEEQYYSIPTVVVRIAKFIGSVSVGGTSIPVGPTPGSGGTLTVPFPINGKVTISIKDIANGLLKTGSKILADVINAVGNIPISSTSGTTVGDILDLGITTSGQFRIGLKLDDSTTVWFNLEVQAPPFPTQSRDRYFTGSIDTGIDSYRLNNLEFFNATTGENLGTYRLDGSSGTFVYASENEILSDTELDGVLDGSLASNSLRMSQPVVFWKESASSTLVQFATVFSAVGSIEVRVKDSGGNLLKTVRHTLTTEPNFGGLLSFLDARIRSIATPGVSPWSLLPPTNGIDDDDAGAAEGAQPPSLAAAPGGSGSSVPPPVAATGWQTNFLIKGAAISDKAIATLNPVGVYTLKIGGGFIKGYIDGVWDGLVSDVTGIAELAKIVAEGFTGDFHRVKAMWDGIRSLVALDAAGREALFDSMLRKFVDRSTVAVPWTPAGSNSDEWGASAYMSGYCGGFITEQFLAICVGGGIISKAGQSVKAAMLSTTIGQVTAAMVSNTRRFVTAGALAASKHVSAYGSNAVRAVRKAMEDVSKSVVFQGKLVGEEVGALMERLGASQFSYQFIADRISLVALDEAQWLRVLPTLQERLADLSARLGLQLTDSGARGFAQYWTRSLQVQVVPPGDLMGHFLHVCSANGTLDTQAVARILEMFDGAGSSTFKFTQDALDVSKWISPAGWIYERGGWEGHRINHVLAHGTPNYVAIGKGPKQTHSVFSGLRQDIFRLIDEAWTKPKVHPIVDGLADETTWICDMGRVIGTNGQTKILIAVKNSGSRTITTAFPFAP